MWESLDLVFHKFAENIILYGAAIMALWMGLKRVYKLAKNIDTVTDYVKNRKTKDIDNDNAIVELLREVKPNGGSSMKDQLSGIQREVATISGRLSSMEQWKKDMGG